MVALETGRKESRVIIGCGLTNDRLWDGWRERRLRAGFHAHNMSFTHDSQRSRLPRCCRVGKGTASNGPCHPVLAPSSRIGRTSAPDYLATADTLLDRALSPAAFW